MISHHPTYGWTITEPSEALIDYIIAQGWAEIQMNRGGGWTPPPSGRKVGINDMTKEICDEYFFVPFLTGGTKLIFCPPLWKLFNTLSRKPLPEKTWETW